MLDLYDEDVLMQHAGLKPVLPGAYLNVVSKGLEKRGYLSKGDWELTELGHAAVDEILKRDEKKK